MRALILPLLLVAAPAAAQSEAPAAPPEVRSCLPLSQLRSNTVVDGQTIDFQLRDGSVWRNRLPRSCPTLAFNQAFSYSTTIPQLCNVDIIRVIVQGNPGIVGASCGLGKFERLPPKPRKAKAGASG
jgi:hypothetical protein